VEQTQELLQKWDDRVLRLRPRMEIAGEGLTLGAGTVFAAGEDSHFTTSRAPWRCSRRPMSAQSRLALSPSFGAPANAGPRARKRSPIFISPMPACRLAATNRRCVLFVADELLEAGITPAGVMKAQGFDPAPLDLLKFTPDQPRVPAGSGRESGEWTSGGAGNGRHSGESTSDDANITPVAFRHRGHGRGRGFDWIRHFLELFGERRKQPAPEEKPPEPEVAKPKTEPVHPPAAEHGISTPKPFDFVGEDFGKLGVGIEKPDLDIGEITGHASDRMTEYGQSFSDIQRTVSDPLIVLKQSDGRLYYLSDNAAVVLDRRGRVVTTYPSWKFKDDVKAILDHVHNRSQR
jgi:hypothetical protein